MRSFTTSGAPGRCRKCFILEAHCICARVPTVQTRTEVIVVRHERESWKSTGTARIAALAMPNLKFVEYREDAQPALTELPSVTSGAHLLFPGEGAGPLTQGVTRLIVLDGTWRQTRKMFGKLPMLHSVPKVALPPAGEAKVMRLRESSFEEGRSTIEAIAEAIALIEGADVAAPLHALHADYVERVFKARGVWDQKKADFDEG
ncbi:MAG: tRNA-uridine aminocarboxypropyltransferase [Archangium sp.]